MRPYVIIFSTITLDGRLASKTGFSELSCKWDKMRQNKLRAEVDAIVIGANTVRIDNPSLKVKWFTNNSPIRVIVSSSLKLDPSLRIFQIPPKTVVYTSISHDTSAEKELSERGVDVIVMDGVCNIITDLYERYGVRRVMIEGGGRLNWSVIKEGCVDEIRVTISNKIFGRGVSFAEGEGFERDEFNRFEIASFKKCECEKEIHLIFKKT
ncbi:diaminohydroxyphosphoribosylaminopyrimidine reductase [Sulfolobales archaeon HS-7]|nr:diaminohydroxyphosphoribosylaminopyrimidine reductase [Sulfolobales archaeon HS-7]